MWPTRILGFSCLSPFRAGGVDWRPAMGQAADVLAPRLAARPGLRVSPFLRVFCGDLAWARQDIRRVYADLDRFIADATDFGFHVLPSCITDAGREGAYPDGLDAHVRRLEEVFADWPTTVGPKEVGNEAFDGEQGGRLDPARCRDLALRMAGDVGYSAGPDDESTLYAGGAWVPRHQDRGRDRWNRVRRVRENQAVRDLVKKPVLEQESIGAGDVYEPGRRDNDPAAFFCEGVLNRLFETAGFIGHSQNGLHCQPWSPQQAACLEALVDGYLLWPDDLPLTYRNVGHTEDTAPIRKANIIDEEKNPDGAVTRLYAGIDPSGRRGMLVVVGAKNGRDLGIEWQHGWGFADDPMAYREATDGRHVAVWEIAR